MFNLFKFRKFKPTQDLIIYANTMLFQMVDYAPEGFTPMASLTKIKNKFIGHLEVYSKQGPFIVEVTAQDPKSVVDRLDKRIKDEMSKWRVRKLLEAAPSFWRMQKPEWA